MNKFKEWLMNFINGFCMALADSVPGVSGGTVAFILGFYDKFVQSIDDLISGKLDKKKEAIKFLIKIAIGWVIGFALAASILSDLFKSKIYIMSSLFIGFIIFAIPVVIKEEKSSLKGKYKNILFAVIGCAIVVGITTLKSGSTIDVNTISFFNCLYIIVAAAVAISAMILPGISGSTILLIFGLYVPIMDKIKTLLKFDFTALPVIIIFAFGIIIGAVIFPKLLRKSLEKHRSPTIYAVLGMMIGSLYSIVKGPTTLEGNLSPLSFSTFNVWAFLLGGAIIVGLEFLKRKINKK